MYRTGSILLLGFSLCSFASSLPSQAMTPEAAGVSQLLLRSDERVKLVFINNVKISKLSAFTSQRGRKHLRFNGGKLR